MTEMVLPGDLGPGDVIVLPDAQEEMVVRAVRLGRGGFIVTLGPLAGGSLAQRVVTLTAATPMCRTGRVSHF